VTAFDTAVNIHYIRFISRGDTDMTLAQYKKAIETEYRAEWGRDADVAELWFLGRCNGILACEQLKAGVSWKSVYHRLVELAANA
jgi:hypothetical protein